MYTKHSWTDSVEPNADKQRTVENELRMTADAKTYRH